MAKLKLKYEAPSINSLGGESLIPLAQICTPGGTPAGQCRTGGNAVISECRTGGTAATRCRPGGTAGRCQPGSSAL